MQEMKELAREYVKTHNGYCKKMTDYSFEFVPAPTKDNKEPKTYIVMKSYFWKRNKYDN